MNFGDQHNVQWQGVVAVLAPFGMGRMYQHGPAAYHEFRLGPGRSKRAVPVALRLHVHGETAEFRQAVNVLAQVVFRSLAIVAALDNPGFAGTDDEGPAAVILVLQELKRVGPLVGYVDQTPIPWQMLRPFDPQPALARGACPVLGHGLLFRHLVTAVQDLVHKPQHRMGLGINRQDVLTDISAALAAADLSQMFGQRRTIGIVQFRGVVDQKHGSLAGGNVCRRVGPQWRHQSLMRHFLAIHETIQGLQVSGRGHFVRQSAAGVTTQLIKRRHQPGRAPPVSQLCASEHRIAQGFVSVHVQGHGMAPPSPGWFCRVAADCSTVIPTPMIARPRIVKSTIHRETHCNSNPVTMLRRLAPSKFNRGFVKITTPN